METAAPLARAIELLSKLPGIGEKTAARLALHLLKRPAGEVEALAQSLTDLKERIKLCSICFNITHDDPCAICLSPERNAEVVAVVEDFSDLIAIERSGAFRGKYHVLGGTISPLDGVGPQDLKIAELKTRLKNEPIKEIILATNPTAEGEATAQYLMEELASFGVNLSRIAYGLPLGGDLQYADRLTLAQSLENRRELKKT